MPLIKLNPRPGDRILYLAHKVAPSHRLVGGNHVLQPLSYGYEPNATLALVEGIADSLDNEYGYNSSAAGGRVYEDSVGFRCFPSWQRKAHHVRATVHPATIETSLDVLSQHGLSFEAMLFAAQFVAPQVIGTQEYCTLVADVTGRSNLPASVAAVREAVMEKAASFSIEYIPLTDEALEPRQLLPEHETRIEDTYSRYTEAWTENVPTPAPPSVEDADYDETEDLEDF